MAGRESVVSAILQHKSYETFLPLYAVRRQWADRTKTVRRPLFPGYLFCRFSERANGLIVTTPGVVRVVGIGRMPVAIDDADVKAIQQITMSDLPTSPANYLRAGEAIV